MMVETGAANRTKSRVTMPPSTMNSKMLAPMTCPPSFTRPAPIFCPSRMVVPMAKLATSPVMSIMIWEPVATADTSAEVVNCPTMRRSTAPYIACRNSAASTGSENRISGAAMGPVVKSPYCCFLRFIKVS